MNKNTPLFTGMQNGLTTEVAIIGAGCSGLYTAYRLTVDAGRPGRDVQIFDMAEKLGGRLESIIMPGMDFWGELGGMRYLTSQKIVTTLIEEVFAAQMQPAAFPMGDPAKLLMYLRKQRFHQNDWQLEQAEGRQLATRYYLNSDDNGYSSDQLFNKIIYDVLMADPWFVTNFPGKAEQTGPYDYAFYLTSEDWAVVKPALTYHFPASHYNLLKVNDIGFWNLIKDQVSQEGYAFLANAGGYYSNTINWNSAEAFPYMVGDFSSNPTYKTIAEGYDSIAYALANAYTDVADARIWSQNKLLTFTNVHPRSADFRYELLFLNLASNEQWKVYANTIVLAMPRKSLELLDQENFFFDVNQHAELNENIRSVIMEPAFKILMGFESPWWRQEPLNIDSGHSITDLPMRQCYYFGTNATGAPNSMLLGSYGDMTTQTFWKPLSDAKILFKPRATRSVALDQMKDFEEDQASQVMVDEVMDQLRELHGPEVDIPAPYITYFRDWTDDPYGAGYHAWKAGFDVRYVMRYMRKPFDTESIHICGEAYSTQQGWVEGAFCVAENMLREHFGLAWPTWLEEGYFLSW